MDNRGLRDRLDAYREAEKELERKAKEIGGTLVEADIENLVEDTRIALSLLAGGVPQDPKNTLRRSVLELWRLIGKQLALSSRPSPVKTDKSLSNSSRSR